MFFPGTLLLMLRCVAVMKGVVGQCKLAGIEPLILLGEKSASGVDQFIDRGL